MNFKSIKNKDNASHMSTYARYPVVLESGKGAVATDINNKSYIDFGSGIGVNSLGYCDDGWVSAVVKQAATLQHISNLYYNPVQTELSDRLTTLTGMSKVFLCNSGAEANECAVKLARKYSFDKYGKGRSTIVTLTNSFHGRTVTTLSATGQEDMHRYFFPFTEGFLHANIGDPNEIFSKIDQNTCAVMIECIQGEGGVIPLAREFLCAISEFCRRKDILLIVDEVQTGMGRTGKLLASEHYGVSPDIVTLAKGLGGGLPIGACLCNEVLSRVLAPGQHGSTFGGNPIVCAGALHVLSRVADPLFLRDVTEKGQYMRERISKIPHVIAVQGMGLMLGIRLDFDDPKIVVQSALDAGLLILTAKNCLRALPPLIISYDEIDRGLSILNDCLLK